MKTKEELLAIATSIKEIISDLSKDELVSVLNNAIGGNNEFAFVPYQMIWMVAAGVKAEKVIIGLTEEGKIGVQFCAPKDGKLELPNKEGGF